MWAAIDVILVLHLTSLCLKVSKAKVTRQEATGGLPKDSQIL